MRRFMTTVPDFYVRGRHIPPGEAWVTHETVVGAAVNMVEGRIKVEKIIGKKFDPAQDWSNKKILIIRNGGAGDLLFAKPMIYDIHRRWPSARLSLMCNRDFFFVMSDCADYMNFYDNPIPQGIFESFDAVIDLEHLTEEHDNGRLMSGVEVFAAEAGIKLQDMRPSYQPSKEVLRYVQNEFPRTPGLKRVVVQMHSDAVSRNYPEDNWAVVIMYLLNKGYQVFLAGHPKLSKLEIDHPNYKNLLRHKPTLSWEQATAVLKTADLVIGQDSSTVHFSGAMDVPTIALYGPFPSQYRSAMHPCVINIDGEGKCRPCFFFGRRHTTWPENGPCVEDKKCSVLKNIPPEKIIQHALAILA